MVMDWELPTVNFLWEYYYVQVVGDYLPRTKKREKCETFPVT